MDSKIVTKLVKGALFGWLIAFIIGYFIGNRTITGFVYNKDLSFLFWVFMSAAPGILGGILSVYVYERLSQINKDN